MDSKPDDGSLTPAEWRFLISTALRALINAAIGATPGIIMVILMTYDYPGVAVAIMGALLASVAALAELSPLRMIRLAVGIFVVGILPVSTRALSDSLTGADVPVNNDSASALLFKWLGAPCPQPHHWIMFGGAAIGFIFGGVFLYFDYQQTIAHGSGVFLPMSRSDAHLISDAAILNGVFAIWGGMLGGLVASRRYRRPLTFFCLIAGMIGGTAMVACMSAGMNERTMWGFPIVFVTAAGVATLALTFLITYDAGHSPPPPEVNPEAADTSSEVE